MGWHEVGTVGELSEDQPLPVSVGEHLIALYKLGDKVFATSNVCTHQFALLSDGYVDGNCIECPLHQALFDIATGELRSGPVCDSLKTYPIRIEGDRVFVDAD